LLNQKDGQIALDYLIKKRKLNKDIIDKYNIGYCPLNISHQLRGRIITPIYDVYGKLITLSTRHLNENIKNRFWHETFDKAYYLYGLFEAKKNIIKNQKVLIVEGEMDALCYQSNGINIAVSICGSALTIYQVAILSRYVSEFFIMLDGDDVGQEAIKRIMKKIYNKYNLDSYQLSFIPIKIPNKMDPDEYLIKNGTKEVIKLLKKTKEQLNEFE